MIKKTRICPECHSEDIREDWKLRGTIYECKNCGYRGVLILEMSETFHQFKTGG